MPVFDPNKSKIKMVVLTSGRNSNVVWYSPIKQNKRPSHLIIQAMLRRLAKKTEITSITNCIHFYENNSTNPIAIAKP